MTGENGSLTSPNFPGTYPSQLHCHWSVNVSVGYVIQITFDDVTLEPSKRCLYDYIMVRVASSDPHTLTYS